MCPGSHTPQIGPVPLMIASQDAHKKGQIKPFLQDGRAACTVDSINHPFICELLGLLTDLPSRTGLPAAGGLCPLLLPAALHSLLSHSCLVPTGPARGQSARHLPRLLCPTPCSCGGSRADVPPGGTEYGVQAFPKLEAEKQEEAAEQDED